MLCSTLCPCRNNPSALAHGQRTSVEGAAEWPTAQLPDSATGATLQAHCLPRSASRPVPAENDRAMQACGLWT